MIASELSLELMEEVTQIDIPDAHIRYYEELEMFGDLEASK